MKKKKRNLKSFSNTAAYRTIIFPDIIWKIQIWKYFLSINKHITKKEKKNHFFSGGGQEPHSLYYSKASFLVTFYINFNDYKL